MGRLSLLLVALALVLASCESLALASAASISVALSHERDALLDARLSPQQVRLAPGEGADLRLEVRNNGRGPVEVTLSATVQGPSDQIVVRLPSTVQLRAAVTQVLVHVAATQSVTPGRYAVTIALGPPATARKPEDPVGSNE